MRVGYDFDELRFDGHEKNVSAWLDEDGISVVFPRFFIFSCIIKIMGMFGKR